MKKLLKNLARYAVDLALVAGAAAVAVGAGMIYLPAGLITGGVLAMAGAVLLLLGDVLARVIIAPVILPIGAITSFLGAPLFLYLLFKGGTKQ